MMNPIERLEALNAAPSEKPVYKQPQKKDPIDNFTQVEWKNKHDGKTYIAKKMTLTQNGKKVTGVYVFDKSQMPDKMGNVAGQFMSYETFFNKMTSEVPSVTASSAKAYFPNISQKSSDIDFDKIFDRGLKLSDGALILKPVMAGSIQKLSKEDDGTYKFTTQAVRMGSEPHTRIVSEDDILNRRELCAGTVKKLESGDYEITYFESSNLKNKETKTEVMNASDCAKFLKNNFMTTYEN